MTKADKTKSFIAQKTAILFNTRGYAGTSLSDITRATGLTKGSVYGNFENKEAVASAAFEYNVNRVFEGLKSTQLVNRSARENLSALFAFHVENWREIAANGGCPLLNAAVEADDHLLFLKAAVQGSFKLWAKRISFLIREGIDRGEFKKDLVVDQYANTFIMLIQGGVMLTKINDDATHIQTAVCRIEQIIEEELMN